MKLARLRIRNFRCYQDEFSIDFHNLTVLVGRNDIGKSTILDALGIFFEEVKIDSDDGCVKSDKKEVRIICEFDDLPKNLIIDSDYPTNLTREYLVNSEGRLEIHKVFDANLKTPKQTGVFANAVHPNAKNRDDLLLLKNADLKKRADQLGLNIEGVDQKINTQLRHRIWETAENLELTLREIPLDVETAKKIWEQLRLYLPSYALFKSDRSSTDQDVEAQDPMKLAVKEALKAKEEELKTIAEFVEKEVKSIAENTLQKIREMDEALASELNPVFTPPNWSNVFKISLTSEEAIPLNKRGSGIRRLVLLNFFRAKTEQLASSKDTKSVIYAIEEPETSQHPNNQVMLINALQELAEYPEHQVIITTHTPNLARIVPDKSLRFIHLDPTSKGKRVVISGDENAYRSISKTLGVLPDNDIKIFIGLEGCHDIEYLKIISHILHENGEDIIDLCDMEEKGEVIFFPLGGSNLALWTSRLANLNRPEFYLFDRDETPPAKPKHQDTVDQINLRPNCVAVSTGKKEMENYIHPLAIKRVKPDLNLTFGDFDDVPLMVAKAVHDCSESPNLWETLDDDTKGKKASKAKNWLNAEATKHMTHEWLSEIDPQGDVRSWMASIKKLIDNPLSAEPTSHPISLPSRPVRQPRSPS